MDKNTGQSRCVAVARFATEEAMNEAIRSMNEKEFEGRVITIRRFVPRNQQGNSKYNEGSNSKRKTFFEEEKPAEEETAVEEEKPVEEESEEKKDKKDKKDKKEKEEKKKEKKDKKD